MSLDTALRQRAWSNRKVCSCYRISGLLGNIYSFVFASFTPGELLAFSAEADEVSFQYIKKPLFKTAFSDFTLSESFVFSFRRNEQNMSLTPKRYCPAGSGRGFHYTKKRRSVKDGVFQNTFGPTRILRYPSVCEVACGNV